MQVLLQSTGVMLSECIGQTCSFLICVTPAHDDTSVNLTRTKTRSGVRVAQLGIPSDWIGLNKFSIKFSNTRHRHHTPPTMTSLSDEPARDFFARSDKSVLSGIDEFLDPESRLRLSEASTDTQVTFGTTSASVLAQQVKRQLDDNKDQQRRLREEFEAAMKPLRKREYELSEQLRQMTDRRRMREKKFPFGYMLSLYDLGYRFSKSYKNALLNLREVPLALFRLGRTVDVSPFVFGFPAPHNELPGGARSEYGTQGQVVNAWFPTIFHETTTLHDMLIPDHFREMQRVVSEHVGDLMPYIEHTTQILQDGGEDLTVLWRSTFRKDHRPLDEVNRFVGLLMFVMVCFPYIALERSTLVDALVSLTPTPFRFVNEEQIPGAQRMVRCMIPDLLQYADDNHMRWHWIRAVTARNPGFSGGAGAGAGAIDSSDVE